MKRIFKTTSVENRTGFREELVEKFVQQNLPPKTTTKSKISGMGSFANRFKEIEYCAAETPVTGSIEIILSLKYFNSKKRVNVPISSLFFVFCVRDEKDDYKVARSCSLS